MRHVREFAVASTLCLTLVIIPCSLAHSPVFHHGKDAATADTKDIKFKHEFDAVQKIHNHLDDDKNGDVDVAETREFLQSELHVEENKRHTNFHSQDKLVSVDDLWNAWRNNEVSQWTPEDVVNWLKTVVHLPQYAGEFLKKKINGHQLPRLASEDGALFNELKMSNVIDRKKIALRAMDIVLFGAPSKGDEEARLKLEFDAVRKIHVHLDDDKNGDVDFKESKEFLQQELHVQDNKRHKQFHSGDGSISVDDLWKAWLKNDVSQWTPEQIVDWLNSVVHLPQYAELFLENKINGRHLPRLASDDGALLNELKISNVIDRKKIALRAMDVVLFGAPTKGHNYLKDLLLGLAVIVAVGSFWFSNVQKRKAQTQLGTMMKDIEYLQEAEKNLTNLQDRLQQAETSRQKIQQEKHQLESNLKDEIAAAKREAHRLRAAREDQSEEIHTRLMLAEDELVQVREALRKAEKEVEYLSSSDTSQSLEKWLQITYEKEVKNFAQRRAAALRKMEIAKDACNKINRKRTSLFGSLRLAHDQNIDEVDQKILAARSSLAEVTNDLEELQHRWQQIETCCHVDLGVNSTLMTETAEASPSPLGQALAMVGKVGSLGSPKTTPECKIQRVSTYPSLHSILDTNPPNRTTSYNNISRQTSAIVDGSSTSGDDNIFFKDSNIQLDGHRSSPEKTEFGSGTTSNGYNNGMGDDHHKQFPNPGNISVIPETDVRSSTGSLRIQKSNLGENGMIEATKSKKKYSLSTDKSKAIHKKKWWSRNKRNQNDEIDGESESEAPEQHYSSSLPVLTNLSDSKDQFYIWEDTN